MKNLIVLIIGIALISCNSNKTSTELKNEVKQSGKVKKVMFEPKRIDAPNGLYEQFYPNGKPKMRGMVKNGLYDGEWISWYESGIKWSQTTFKKGLRDGKTASWYPNGNIRYIGNYMQEKQIGTWRYYDEEGNLIKTEKY